MKHLTDSWCLGYLTPRYTHAIGALRHNHIFLSGEDCYALRCAFLHEGADDVARQRARKALDSFLFIEPPLSGSIHCNQSNAKLQLQVDIFCEDLCVGVDSWARHVLTNDAAVQARMEELLVVRSISGGVSF